MVFCLMQAKKNQSVLESSLVPFNYLDNYLSTDELLLHILSFLNLQELSGLRQVSHRMSELAADPVLMAAKIKKHFPGCSYTDLKTAYEKEYPDFNPKQRFLTYLLKEGMNAQFTSKVSFYDFHHQSKFLKMMRSLNNQVALDYCFKLTSDQLVATEFVLHYACVYRQPLETIKSLLSLRPNINFSNAVHLAAVDGRTDLLNLFYLRGKVDFNMKNFDGSPLFLAAKHGQLEALKFLLSISGIEVNKANSDGYTPLFIAAMQGNTAIVKQLITDPNIDINTAIMNGATPLLVAVIHNHVGVVEALAGHSKIEIDKVVSNNGATALFMAAQEGHTPSVNALLRNGAKLDCVIEAKVSVLLDLVAANNKSAQLVDFLLKRYGTLPQVLPNYTPLDVAVLSGHKDIVALLLAKKPVLSKEKLNYLGEMAEAMGYAEIGEQLEAWRLLGEAKEGRTTNQNRFWSHSTSTSSLKLLETPSPEPG